MEAADSALLDKGNSLKRSSVMEISKDALVGSVSAAGCPRCQTRREVWGTEPRLNSFPLVSVQDEAVSGGASPFSGPQGAGLEGPRPADTDGVTTFSGTGPPGALDRQEPGSSGLAKVCVCVWMERGTGMKKLLKRKKQQQQSFVSAFPLEWQR